MTDPVSSSSDEEGESSDEGESSTWLQESSSSASAASMVPVDGPPAAESGLAALDAPCKADVATQTCRAWPIYSSWNWVYQAPHRPVPHAQGRIISAP